MTAGQPVTDKQPGARTREDGLDCGLPSVSIRRQSEGWPGLDAATPDSAGKVQRPHRTNDNQATRPSGIILGSLRAPSTQFRFLRSHRKHVLLSLREESSREGSNDNRFNKESHERFSGSYRCEGRAEAVVVTWIKGAAVKADDT